MLKKNLQNILKSILQLSFKIQILASLFLLGQPMKLIIFM